MSEVPLYPCFEKEQDLDDNTTPDCWRGYYFGIALGSGLQKSTSTGLRVKLAFGTQSRTLTWNAWNVKSRLLKRCAELADKMPTPKVQVDVLHQDPSTLHLGCEHQHFTSDVKVNISPRMCRAAAEYSSDGWKREFKLPWREAGPPNHHDDKVDSDQ